MSSNSHHIHLETPGDDAEIDHLHEIAFGPGRFARSAFRLREGVPHDPALSFVAKNGDTLIGSVRLTPILIGPEPALLLGPLAVLPPYKNKGAGKALVRRAVEEAGHLGHGLVVLVGDEPYYGPLGFRRVPHGSIAFPGPVDPDRILVCELVEGAAARAVGVARSERPIPVPS